MKLARKITLTLVLPAFVVIAGLEAVGSSRPLASRILGVDRKTLYRKLERRSAEVGERVEKAERPS